MAAAPMSTKEVAEELGTDQKTLRKFFRSEDSPVERVGQGNRYAVTRAELKRISKAFSVWQTAHTRQQEAA